MYVLPAAAIPFLSLKSYSAVYGHSVTVKESLELSRLCYGAREVRLCALPLDPIVQPTPNNGSPTGFVEYKLGNHRDRTDESGQQSPP